MSISILDRLQDYQSFLDLTWIDHPQYGTIYSKGQIGFFGVLLGIFFGVNLTLSALFFYLYFIVQYTTDGFLYSLLFWCPYAALLSLFHILEFIITSIFQPSTLSYNSYLINHSLAYSCAAIISWIEFWISYLIFGNKKFYFWWISLLGIVFVISGQFLRTLAMISCGENFSHTIANTKREQHKLVTSGIYRIFRHPSYTGWFYWSIGTQLILLNPISFIGYAYTTYKFMKERIEFEEKLLLKFFAQDYADYIEKSYIFIPFIPNKSLRARD